jgi:hypothetical protein
MLLNALVEQPRFTLIGFAIIMLGIPAFYLRLWYGRRSGERPDTRR